MARIRLLLIAAFACAATMYTSSGLSGEGSASLSPPEQRWQQLLAGGLDEPLTSYVSLLEQILASGQFEAQPCRDAQAQLSELATPLAGSSMLAIVEMECAKAAADQSAAEAALSRYEALLQEQTVRRAANPNAPLRLWLFLDGEVYSIDNDGEFLYETLIEDPVSGQLATVLSFRDSDGVERELSYDWLAPLLALQAAETGIYVPPLRLVQVEPLLQAISTEGGYPMVQALLERFRLLRLPPGDERTSAMLAAAQSDAMEGIALAQQCLIYAFWRCQSVAADLLVGGLELGLGRAIVLQAYISAEGIGAEADLDTAIALLDGASERMAGNTPLVLLSALLQQRPESSLAALVQQRIEQAAMQGTPWAVAHWLDRVDHQQPLSEPQLAVVQQAAAAGLWSARRYLADEAAFHGDLARQHAELATLAAEGDVHAQYILAGILRDQPEAEARQAAEQWMTLAAQRGHVRAMRLDARRLLASGDPTLSRRGAGQMSIASRHLRAARVEVGLALLEGYGDQAPDRERAIEHLQQLYEQEDSYPAGAFVYLIHRLGLHGKSSRRQAKRWLQKLEAHSSVVEAADTEAMGTDALALQLVALALEPLTERLEWAERQLTLLEESLRTDSSTSANQLAWALCTSKRAELRDPARGEQLSAKTLEQRPEVTAYLDTHAHCLSQLGRHQEALEQQRRALALAQQNEAGRLEIIGYRTRLQVLEKAAAQDAEG